MKKIVLFLAIIFVLSSSVFVLINFKEKYDDQLQPQLITSKYKAGDVIEIKYEMMLGMEKDLFSGLNYYAYRCNIYKSIILIANAFIVLAMCLLVLKKAD